MKRLAIDKIKQHDVIIDGESGAMIGRACLVTWANDGMISGLRLMAVDPSRLMETTTNSHMPFFRPELIDQIQVHQQGEMGLTLLFILALQSLHAAWVQLKHPVEIDAKVLLQTICFGCQCLRLFWYCQIATNVKGKGV